MSLKYFLSKSVKVFPCSYRGSYAGETAPSENSFFDPESRLMTEYNYTHLHGIVAGKNSYIVSIDNTLLKVVIGGYYFELTKPADWVEQNILPRELTLYIKTEACQLIEGSEGSEADSSRSTYYLASMYGDRTPLDNIIGTASYFTGLVYSYVGSGTVPTAFTHKLQITDANGDINHDDYLPELGQVFAGMINETTKALHAIRLNTGNTASAENTVALGEGTVADQLNQTVVGEYNASEPDALFIVGSGSSTAPSNALSVADRETKVKNKLIVALSGEEDTSAGLVATSDETTVKNKLSVGAGFSAESAETKVRTKLTVANVSMTVDGYEGKAKYANKINCSEEEPQMSDTEDVFKTIRQALLDMVYPVGSIYMSVKNESPGVFLGGTWVAWGAGKVPVGVDTSDSDFGECEQKGGYKTKQLNTTELPEHNHEATFSGSDSQSTSENGSHSHKFTDQGTTGSGGNHSHKVYLDAVPAVGTGNAGIQTTTGIHGTKLLGETDEVDSHRHSFFVSGDTDSSGAHSHTYKAEGSVSVSSTGAGNSFSILQPYITCYMWKRTS